MDETDHKIRRFGKFLFSVVKALRYLLVWIALVGVFVAYGFPHDQFYVDASDKLVRTLEDTLSWGGYGTGLATCVVMAWWLLTEIRRRKLGRISAIFCYLTVCIISFLLPGFVMGLPDMLGWENLELFHHGERALVGIVISVMMLETAFAAAVLFILCALIIKKRKT